jgi:hypothetical protein
LVGALSMVNIHLTRAPAAFRWRSHALVDGGAPYRRRAGNLLVAASGFGRQENLRALELAGRMLAATQNAGQRSTFGVVRIDPVSYSVRWGLSHEVLHSKNIVVGPEVGLPQIQTVGNLAQVGTTLFELDLTLAQALTVPHDPAHPEAVLRHSESSPCHMGSKARKLSH